jgi:hypothetical protein
VEIVARQEAELAALVAQPVRRTEMSKGIKFMTAPRVGLAVFVAVTAALVIGG